MLYSNSDQKWFFLIAIAVFLLDSGEWNHFCKNVSWAKIKPCWRISEIKVGVTAWMDHVFVIYCVTNYPETRYLKITCFISLWICGSGTRACLADSSGFWLQVSRAKVAARTAVISALEGEGSATSLTHMLLGGFSSLWVVELRASLFHWLLDRSHSQFFAMWVISRRSSQCGHQLP